MTIAPISPARIGAIRPERSEARPASGLTTASMAALTRNTAPMAAPPTPRSSSRSGTSTSITPLKSAGIVKIQKPNSRAGLPSARSITPIPVLGSGSTPGIDHAQAASTAATTATALKTASGLSTVAAPPRTGPRSTPTMAALSAAPISSPRLSGGAAEMSQAMPAAHMQEPPMPWMKRAVSSRTIVWAKANPRLASPSSASPSSSVGFTPQRVASQPDGSAPMKAPAG
jgi:hypothetical protein